MQNYRMPQSRIAIISSLFLALIYLSCGKSSSKKLDPLTYQCIDAQIKTEFDAAKSYCMDFKFSNQVTYNYTILDCQSANGGSENGFVEFYMDDSLIRSLEINHKEYSQDHIQMMFTHPSIRDRSHYQGKAEVCYSMKFYERNLLNTTEIKFVEHCIPIVNEGDRYMAEVLDNSVSIVELECMDMPMLAVCGANAQKKSFVIEETRRIPRDSNSRLIINEEFIDISGGKEVIVPFYIDVTLSPKPTSFSTGSSIDVLPTPDSCATLSPHLYYRKVFRNEYEAGICDKPDSLISSTEVGTNLFQLGFSRCNLYSYQEQN